MSEGSPSQRLPRQCNPRKFAYAGVEIEGSIDSATMTRLADAVDSIGDLVARLVFSINEAGKMVVSGTVEAQLAQQCQRCLQTMPQARMCVEIMVAIVRDEEEVRNLPKALDPWLVPDDDADVYALIEDELLLALPVVAYHNEVCVEAALMSSGDAEDLAQETDKPNPFSVLSALKDSKSES